MTDEARFIRADRFQTRWDFIDLEALLPADHRARIVWSFVESLDLSALYDSVKSREGEAGRPPPASGRFFGAVALCDGRGDRVGGPSGAACPEPRSPSARAR